MTAKNFKDLLVWQEAYKLTTAIYRVTKHFPPEEQYGLTNQLRRVTVLITSNIAEGFGRSGVKEKDQFYAVANGSLIEVENQLLIAKGVGYIDEKDYQSLDDQ